MVAPFQPHLNEDSEPILVIDRLSKNFRSGKQQVEAITEIHLEIAAGEFVVLFGPSGCGKSTLLNMIAGLDKPTDGEIRVRGQRVTRPHPERLMMFQEHALFPWLNLVQNVTYGLRWKYRFKPRFRRDRGRDLLKMVHLEEFEKARIHQLSGGMKQRAALARALAPDPQILLIDEPFPALDALTRQKLYTDLQEIFTHTGKTIISVTHDPREAACLGDRVIVFTGRPAKIKAEIRVELPRPRDINDPKVAEYAQQILGEMEEGVADENNRANGKHQ
jgi:NitT/TauT family transport system ATP-binding protein